MTTKKNELSSTKALVRCSWGATNDPLMQEYHDQIWGKFTTDDTELFEYLTLEIFQAGLSWSTIIKKQAAFKTAFAGYDLSQIAAFSDKEVARLLNNPAIIRNRLKINATINNARISQVLQQEYGSFNAYLLSVWPEIIDNQPTTDEEVPTISEAAIALTKQLKKAGLKFIGPTITYSFLEATGRINDHLVSCSFKY